MWTKEGGFGRLVGCLLVSSLTAGLLSTAGLASSHQAKIPGRSVKIPFKVGQELSKRLLTAERSRQTVQSSAKLTPLQETISTEALFASGLTVAEELGLVRVSGVGESTNQDQLSSPVVQSPANLKPVTSGSSKVEAGAVTEKSVESTNEISQDTSTSTSDRPPPVQLPESFVSRIVPGAGIVATAQADESVNLAIDADQLNFVKLQSGTIQSQTGDISVTGAVRAGSFVGSGAGLTDLNASALSVGTLAVKRLPGTVSLLGQTIEVEELAGLIPYTKLSMTGAVKNSDLATDAGIAYSKLNLAGSITNTDIASNAAIHHSKLDLNGATITLADQSVTDAKLALPYAQLGSGLARGDKLYVGVFSFDNSYPTGGELVDLSTVFGSAIKAVIVTSSRSGDTFEVDESLFANRQFKLKAFRGNGTEYPNVSNLTSLTNIRYLAIGQ